MLKKNIGDFHKNSSDIPITESTLYNTDESVEHIPFQEKKNLYEAVFDNNQEKLQMMNVEYIDDFNKLLNDVSKYDNKHKIMQYILLIHPEKKQKRCLFFTVFRPL